MSRPSPNNIIQGSTATTDLEAVEGIPAELVPKHIAIIMDGNGRWATKRFLPRLAGHRAGAKSVRTTLEECRKLGVRYLTLYTFSTENWNRPKDEVDGLMKLFVEHLASEAALLLKNNIRLRVIGNLELLSPDVRAELQGALDKTVNCNSLDLILALSYGGRAELLNAVQIIGKKVADGKLSPDDITEKEIREGLYASDVPDPELLIRTSGEFRISNFLLWQIAYSEIVVTNTLWPDFTKDELHKCIKDYLKRERRFGKTSSQIVSEKTI